MTLPKLESEPYEISIRFYCYDDRQSHWKDALPASTPLEVQIRSGILTASNDPASKYFQILFDQFLPAVQQKDDQKANSIIDTELAPLYTQHKAAIEQLADLTEKSQSLREQEAKQRIASRIILLITVIVLSLALMLRVGIYVILSITVPLQSAVTALQRVADRDLTSHLNVVNDDELGRWLPHSTWPFVRSGTVSPMPGALRSAFPGHRVGWKPQR